MLDYLGQLLKSLLLALGTAIWKFFTEFYEWAFTQFVALIQNVLNGIGFDSNLLWAVDIWNNLNFFFPINEGLAMLTVVFGVWSACFVVKIILKLVPTIY